jgi:hypothetical protein
MVKKLFLLAVACFFSVAAFADSAGNRGNSMLAIEYQGFGLSASAIAGPPLRIGYLLSDGLEVGLEYGSNTYTFDSNSATTTNMGLYGRYFLGNSFNVYAALQQRAFKGNFALAGASPNATLSSMAFTAALGNKWQMDWGLTVGVDWLGYSIPFSTSQSFSGTLTTAQEDELASLNTDYNALYTISFASLTIGYSF